MGRYRRRRHQLLLGRRGLLFLLCNGAGGSSLLLLGRNNALDGGLLLVGRSIALGGGLLLRRRSGICDNGLRRDRPGCCGKQQLDGLACGFVVYGSLVITHVAVGDSFNSTVGVIAAPAWEADGLPKEENAGMGLTAGLAATLTSGTPTASGFDFLPKREMGAVKGAG